MLFFSDPRVLNQAKKDGFWDSESFTIRSESCEYEKDPDHPEVTKLAFPLDLITHNIK